MTADSVSPGSHATAVRCAPMQDGAMLYDASRLSNADPALFDAHSWIEKSAATPTPAGRGATLFIEHAGRSWVLRHYRRGGFMARLSADRYLWTGEERNRAFREWRLLHELHVQALPVPAPVAARYRRHGPTYSADLITERIACAQPLSALLAAGPLPASLWRAVGRCICSFHDAGVCHADLNAHNILIDATERVFLIDFDRGTRRAPGTWCAANLARLKRSLEKITRDGPAERFSIREWTVLEQAYHSSSDAPAGVSAS
jgi:3-deoxy-D-manno-octulosonic acid kinase